MLKRFIGLLMLIAVLAPLVLGVIGFFGVRSVVEAVGSSANSRMEAINQRIDQIDARIAEVRDSFAEVAAVANVIGETVRNISNSISAISATIQIPGINIPDISVNFPLIGQVTIPLPNITFPSITIPGVSAVRGFLQTINDVLEDVINSVGAIAELRLIADDLQGAYTEVTSFVNDISEIVAANSVLLVLLCAGGLVWLGVVYLAFLGDWLIRGWGYLTGRD